MAFSFSEYCCRFKGDINFYGGAGQALYELLVWLQRNNPKSNPGIVVPAFISSEAYRAVLAAGFSPKFYTVTTECKVDQDKITNLIDDSTQAVLCAHMFGFPHSFDGVRTCTALNNVFLIEDCTQTIHSWNGTTTLGTIGDCAIFDTGSFLRAPEGAFMLLNKKLWPFKPGYTRRTGSFKSFSLWLKSRGKQFYFLLTKGMDPLGVARITSTQRHASDTEERKVVVNNISRFHQLIVHLTDLDEIVCRRRENYEYLLNGIKRLHSLEPVPKGIFQSQLVYRMGGVYHLREGITPYSFPVLAPEGSRDLLARLLRQAGIGCALQCSEVSSKPGEHHRTTELTERLLEIPVHQGINRHQLERAMQCLHSFEKAGKEVSTSSNTNKLKAKVA